MKTNIVLEKSYLFSVRIVNLYKHLTENKKEYTLAKQILRSGTSIGANIEEAVGGISRKDFKVKLSVSYKEAQETKYWLRLLKDTDYIDEIMFNSMIKDCEELLKLLFTIIKSTNC